MWVLSSVMSVQNRVETLEWIKTFLVAFDAFFIVDMHACLGGLKKG
jgi:hypothetical protein